MSTSQAASTEEFAALAADPAWATQYADPRTLLDRAVALDAVGAARRVWLATNWVERTSPTLRGRVAGRG